MLVERIEARWIATFVNVLRRCALAAGDTVAILSESQSRRVLAELAGLAALQPGARVLHPMVPTPAPASSIPVRSTGVSDAIGRLLPVAQALVASTLDRKRDCSATELRAFSGNALFSTGTDEVAAGHTLGHFDLPVRGSPIALGGEIAAERGVPVAQKSFAS